MSIENLDLIFKPERVAVIGASNQPQSVGFQLLRNLITAGFQGVIYPVNPHHEAVQGIQTYPDVSSLPRVPDLAVIITPAPTVPEVVRDCGRAGIRGLVIISAGFREVGERGARREAELAAAWKEFPGMRIVGPNCLGIIVPSVHLNASFAAGHPADGNIAFLSQSGALCTSVLDWAIREQIGFSNFVSVGNMLDVSFADLIDYFGEDPRNHAIIMYIESLPLGEGGMRTARQFMSAARAFSRNRPIVAYKGGRFAESAAAAASHTGALAGEDAVFDAAFERAGVVRAVDFADIFDTAELLARQRPVRGDRLAIVTNAGGPGVMATDALLAMRGHLAALSAATMAELDKVLPPHWSHGNPVDVIGDAPAARFAEAVRAVEADPGVDAVLVILAPQAVTDPTTTAEALMAVVAEGHKPVLAAWMGGHLVEEGIRRLNGAGLPTYATPEQGVRAFMNLVSHARNQEVLHETPRDIPVAFALDRRKLRDLFDIILVNEQDILTETLSKALLEAYEIPVTKPVAAHTAEDAVAAARRMGYPVVLKVLSPQITHKTDVGGVVLDLDSDEAVRTAFADIVGRARAARPEAEVQGVTVQAMAESRDAVELILGAKKDPTFGAVIMVGMGGVTAEVLRDRALGLPPLNERLARRMLESLRSWPLLTGYRGRPAVNLDRLIEILMRFSYLIADFPEIKEIDINPLIVTADDVLALDARVVIDRALVGQPVKRHSHLVISPYPDEWVRRARLADGTPVLLRPIKPEDEPMWHAMLGAASAESLRFRFRHVFKATTHEMATRYVFIDYDRDMAIVAEIEDRDARKLIGVARMVSDASGDTAEYAVFVADPWQGKGLGTEFTRYMLEIARAMGFKRMVAETSPDNAGMLAVFRQCGCELAFDHADNTVLVSKAL